MLDTQSGHHFMCGVRRIRVEHAFWTAYVADVTAIGDTNDTILGLVTICRDFILFEWDLKPYDRKISLYKPIFACFSLFWSVSNELFSTCTLLGRYSWICFVFTEILSDNDT